MKNQCSNNIYKLVILFFLTFLYISDQLYCQVEYRFSAFGSTRIEALQNARLKAISNSLDEYQIDKTSLPDTIKDAIGSNPSFYIASEKILKTRYSAALKKYEITIFIKVADDKIKALKKELSSSELFKKEPPEITISKD